MLRQRKRSMEARRAPGAAVSPATRSPGLTPYPPEGPPHPRLCGGVNVAAIGCAGCEGLPCLYFKNAASLVVPTLPRGCSSPENPQPGG